MPTSNHIVRCALRVRGTVQGVGFRPTVYRLATARALGGFVRNDGEGVWIEIEGPENEVRDFPTLLRSERPPLSRIDTIETEPLPPRDQRLFEVVPSGDPADVRAEIPADAATCDACLAELRDPKDRRFRYPFINCTDCGPRYTIVQSVPYDRERTTMRAFPLCEECAREYADPSSRRFHAEPNACPVCGPSLELRVPGQLTLRKDEALTTALSLLAQGRIVAVKGLGGFLLAADARNDATVRLLRERKHRPHKPFALMARNLFEVQRIAQLDAPARTLLASPASPIVLVPAKAPGTLAPSIAPGLTELGVMLPYTPLHHWLLTGPVPLLVMTSGNVSEEPIARANEEALARLAGIADAFLLHDREVHTRADDSVVRVTAGVARVLRRARGFVPRSIPLGFEAPPVLAVGPELKNTVCLTRGSEAVLSPHVGDLQNPLAHGFFLEVIEKLRGLLGVTPFAVGHDLHPDFHATRWARQCGLPCIGVQHHHAHIASCLAEHGRHDRVIGVAFDGTGCGPKGELWGGEFLLADLDGFARLGHLRPLALPGGEAAIHQPWRLAVSALLDAGASTGCVARLGAQRLERMRELFARPSLSPRATGAGRWFDAVAALCGVRDEVSYEAQAAIELEALAGGEAADPLPFGLETGEPWSIDLRPTVRALAAELKAGTSTAVLAARFHETFAQLLVLGCVQARDAHGVNTAALSGGCFQNRRLTERAQSLLTRHGFEVLLHREVPPNDGGVALGQAAVAAWRCRAGVLNKEA
jgi:hydrogenase maturation protein HypF